MEQRWSPPTRPPVRRHRTRSVLVVLAVFVGGSLPFGAARYLGDGEACDQREITSVIFDRCIELRREARFGPFWAWGSDRDIDSIARVIVAEGSYPPPPYTGPTAPPAPHPGPPTRSAHK